MKWDFIYNSDSFVPDFLELPEIDDDPQFGPPF